MRKKVLRQKFNSFSCFPTRGKLAQPSVNIFAEKQRSLSAMQFAHVHSCFRVKWNSIWLTSIVSSSNLIKWDLQLNDSVESTDLIPVVMRLNAIKWFGNILFFDNISLLWATFLFFQQSFTIDPHISIGLGVQRTRQINTNLSMRYDSKTDSYSLCCAHIRNPFGQKISGKA